MSIDNAWTRRIRELEAENTELKLIIREKDRIIVEKEAKVDALKVELWRLI